MGWCSATVIFDTLCEALIYDTDDVDKLKLLKVLINILWENDWDCEYDSSFITHPLVKQAFIELDEDMRENIEEMEKWKNG